MTDKQIHDPGLSGYISITAEILSIDFMAEIRELSFATRQPGFNIFLQRFEHYSSYLRSHKKLGNPIPALLKASNDTRIIYTSTDSRFIWDAFLTAHIAACCELFNGSKIYGNQLSPAPLNDLAQQFLAPYKNASREKIYEVVRKLHSMDTVRTMQLLRSLNLITRKTSGFLQLALGAGSGTKDMLALHKTPAIKREELRGEVVYSFNVNQEHVKHIVITDLEESYNALYESYNQQKTPSTFAISADMMDLLEELPNHNFKKRNLVTAIRIDHRMIPDVPAFLGLLSKSIDDNCDLIMSMGAGNTEDEFRGRIEKLTEIFTALEFAKLQPVLLKMHEPGTLEEQHSSLRFGNPSNSTYQILYCSLRKKQLSKAFT